MTKLLIADRDHNERIGIGWLVSSYSLPFEKVLLDDNFEDMVTTIENELPDVVFIELDMIPKAQWHSFKVQVSRYVKQIVVTTTEATFDRAMQAIEIQAINLLVKPHSPDLIKKTLQKCLQGERELTHLLSVKTQISSEDVTYQSLFIDSERPVTPYQLCVMQTENRDSLSHLRSYLEEFEFHFRPSILPLSDLIICVFPEEVLLVKQEVNRLFQTWNEKYGDPLAIVYHSIPTNQQSLHTMYIQSKRALELTFYKGYRQVILLDGDWEWDLIDPFLNPTEQRDWVEMLHNDNPEQIKTWMYQEFLRVKEPYPEPGLIRTRLTSILAQVRRFMKTYQLDKSEFERSYHQVFETILYNPVLYRIVQDILLFIYQLLRGVKKQQELSKVDVIERGILYIETHFRDRNLSLQKVAQFVDRSPAYFSHLLVKKHGMPLSQLITSLRIKEAKKLLRESQLTIQEIATETGFGNANYFSRIFKEQTGATPSNYRKYGLNIETK